MLLFYVLWEVNCILDTVKKEKKNPWDMGQISLYCCFLFIQHQSVLDQAELKMRGEKKVDTAGVTESSDHKRVLSFYNMS